MQEGIVFSHDEICDLIRDRAICEISDKVLGEFLQVSISFYNNRATAIVMNIDGISHLRLKQDKNREE